MEVAALVKHKLWLGDYEFAHCTIKSCYEDENLTRAAALRKAQELAYLGYRRASARPCFQSSTNYLRHLTDAGTQRIVSVHPEMVRLVYIRVVPIHSF